MWPMPLPLRWPPKGDELPRNGLYCLCGIFFKSLTQTCQQQAPVDRGRCLCWTERQRHVHRELRGGAEGSSYNDGGQLTLCARSAHRSCTQCNARPPNTQHTDWTSELQLIVPLKFLIAILITLFNKLIHQREYGRKCRMLQNSVAKFSSVLSGMIDHTAVIFNHLSVSVVRGL